MSDLISRQAAISAIREMSPELFSAYQHNAYVDKQEVMIRLMMLPSAQSEPKWIPVEIKPPKEKKTYWVCTDTGYQCECRWTNNRFGMVESDEWGWSIFDTPQYTKVVAWRELPEPYRKETENAEVH